jgi:hypothetical protein
VFTRSVMKELVETSKWTVFHDKWKKCVFFKIRLHTPVLRDGHMSSPPSVSIMNGCTPDGLVYMNITLKTFGIQENTCSTHLVWCNIPIDLRSNNSVRPDISYQLNNKSNVESQTR